MEQEKPQSRRIFLSVAYDGTNYHGWQLQPGAVTIESELNRALSELLGGEVRVIGASRTDTGVHALCNAAVFDTAARIPAEKFAYALNQRLPEDIRIRESKEVSPDFHPRHTQSRKTYEYRIYNAQMPMPTKRLYSFFTYAKLDVGAMAQAGALLVGEHDFKSFCSVNTQAEMTVRTIYGLEVWRERAGRAYLQSGAAGGESERQSSVCGMENERQSGVCGMESERQSSVCGGESERQSGVCDIENGQRRSGVCGMESGQRQNGEEAGSDIIIRVTGSGFLYNMVRIIAGTLLEVGQGKRKPEDMTAILSACDRSAAGPTAPACGLTLTEYEFFDK